MTATSLREVARRPRPWDAADVRHLAATSLVGFAMVAVSWFGASNALVLRDQVLWLDVGVGGVIVMGAGHVLWLVKVRRVTAVVRTGLMARVGARSAPGQPAGVVGLDRLVATPAMTRFHAPGCPLVAGKPVRAATESAHRRRHRQPCGVCLPAPTADVAAR